MIVLDSDHLAVLQTPGPVAQALAQRLRTAPDRSITTTIVNIEEGLRGWLARIHQAPTPDQEIRGYVNLAGFFALFAGWALLPYDTAAQQRYQDLRAQRLRSIGPQDLKIAAIVLGQPNALLLSANLRHFRLVPGLRVEDWIH